MSDDDETLDEEYTNNMLDLVFVCDCTGSMGSYLDAAQSNINSIVSEIATEGSCDVRFALVCYRDHPPQDETYVVRASEFTGSAAAMKSLVDQMAAEGGGDGPEAVADGLAAAYRMRWREAATKVVILIADAPPHGLEPEGDATAAASGSGGNPSDGFPRGCPCGVDPLEVAHKMARKGVVVYAIGAEPTLSTEYVLARDLMRAVAAVTSGQFMPLASAALLAKVIVGGALEELELTALMAQIRIEATNARVTPEGAPIATKDDVARAVAYSLQQQAVTTTHTQVDDIYAGELRPLDPAWLRCPSVTAARTAFAAAAQRIRPRTEPPPPPNCTPCTSLSDMDSAMSNPDIDMPVAPMAMAAAVAALADENTLDFQLQQQQQQLQQPGQTASYARGTISVEQVRRALERGINTGLFK